MFDIVKTAVGDSQTSGEQIQSLIPLFISRVAVQPEQADATQEPEMMKDLTLTASPQAVELTAHHDSELTALTVLLVVLYTIWADITGRLFEYLQCEPYRLYEGGKVQEQLVGRWMLHPDVRCDEGPFWQIMACASCGLFLWSFGIPIVIFVVIARLGKKRFTPECIACYGFFYQGFEPAYWYWDLIVKRFDVFVMTAVAHTNIVPDLRAKLLWYMLQSGIMLALHNFCKPLDQRRAGLLDFIESLALSVRSQERKCRPPGVHIAAVSTQCCETEWHME